MVHPYSFLTVGVRRVAGNTRIEVAFFTEEAENLDGLVVEVGGDLVEQVGEEAAEELRETYEEWKDAGKPAPLPGYGDA